MGMKFLRFATDPNPAGEFFGDFRLFKGGKGGDAPKAPDPVQTANAQGQMSKDVALWNSALNNVNQITPFGNLTWTLGSNTNSSGAPVYDYDAYNAALASFNSAINSLSQNNSSKPGSMGTSIPNFGGVGQSGSASGAAYGLKAPSLSDYQIGGGSSKYSGLPQWTSRVTLSPESQAIFDSYMRQQQQLGGLSESALNQVASAYANPYNYDSLQALYGADDLNAARTRTEEAIYSRLNPQFAKDEEALRTRLINQGIGQGSQAYAREMENFNQMKNDARMQAVLAGGTESDRALSQSLALRQQGIQELDKLRGQPLNEYLAMSGQQQLAMPQFQQYGYQGAATPDYQGLVNQNYQNQMAQYNANQASSNNLMSGLFGLGGSFLGAAGQAGGVGALFAGLSDIRAKENIKHIGEENGFPIYEFSYKSEPDRRFIGVMAQDVEKIMPEAVGELDGYKTVNYDMIGVEMREVANG